MNDCGIWYDNLLGLLLIPGIKSDIEMTETYCIMHTVCIAAVSNLIYRDIESLMDRFTFHALRFILLYRVLCNRHKSPFTIPRELLFQVLNQDNLLAAKLIKV